jgi:hypothetical protein
MFMAVHSTFLQNAQLAHRVAHHCWTACPSGLSLQVELNLNMPAGENWCVKLVRFRDDPTPAAMNARRAWREVLQQEKAQPTAAAEAWSRWSGLAQLASVDLRLIGTRRKLTAGFLVPLAEACGSRLQMLLLDAAVKQPGELAVLLPACSSLTTLDVSFSSCEFSSEDLAAIAGLQQLVTLRLQRCKPMLRDDVVPALAQLQWLEMQPVRPMIFT